jgi:hypothetical protein
MFQRNSALAQWFRARTENARGTRKLMIVALARKLLIALWRLVHGADIHYMDFAPQRVSSRLCLFRVRFGIWIAWIGQATRAQKPPAQAPAINPVVWPPARWTKSSHRRPSDPVGNGLAASLARPEANVTGFISHHSGGSPL